MTDPQQQALPLHEAWVEDLMTKIQAFGLACFLQESKDMQIEMHQEIRTALAASAPSREATIQSGLKVPDGWKLVPIEPTDEMTEAGFERLCAGTPIHDDADRCWESMLAASPSSPSVAAEETGNG